MFETKGTHNCCLKSMEVYTPKYLFTYFKKFKQKLKLFGQPVLSAFWKLNTGEQIFPIYLSIALKKVKVSRFSEICL